MSFYIYETQYEPECEERKTKQERGVGMREIKFRVFGKENQIMLGWDELVNAPDLKEMLLHGHEEDAYYSLLMQYTSLKDKNGVEIYEGDFIRHNNRDWDVDGIYKVIWGGSNFPAWDVYPWYDSETAFFSEYENADEFGELEIIGNIYENPELLEAAE